MQTTVFFLNGGKFLFPSSMMGFWRCQILCQHPLFDIKLCGIILTACTKAAAQSLCIFYENRKCFVLLVLHYFEDSGEVTCNSIICGLRMSLGWLLIELSVFLNRYWSAGLFSVWSTGPINQCLYLLLRKPPRPCSTFNRVEIMLLLVSAATGHSVWETNEGKCQFWRA